MKGAGRHLKWLGAACLLAAAMAWMFSKAGPEAYQAAAPKELAVVKAATPETEQVIMERNRAARQNAAAGLPEAVESPHPMGSAKNAEWIDQRAEELEGLAWFSDAASLDRILAEMRNTQPEIRKAALQAVVSFGSKDAIPKLEILAKGTNDLVEQKAIADAIEYLSLPTMVEYLEENPSGEQVQMGEPIR